jgi:hypothetical protein
MLILHIIDSLVTGGVQNLLLTFHKCAHNQDISIVVLTLSSYDNQPLVTRLRSNGVEVVFFRHPG